MPDQISYLQTGPLLNIQHEAGFSFYAVVKFLLPASVFFPITMLLLEDEKILPGPSNADHEDIRILGKGRYSFWKGMVYFSTPDNSDPRFNGRIYKVQYVPNLFTRFTRFLPGRVWRILIITIEPAAALLRRIWRILHAMFYRMFLFIKKILKALFPQRLLILPQRVFNRLRRIDPVEDSWSFFYRLCFIQVLLQERFAKKLLKRRKSNEFEKNNQKNNS